MERRCHLLPLVLHFGHLPFLFANFFLGFPVGTEQRELGLTTLIHRRFACAQHLRTAE